MRYAWLIALAVVATTGCNQAELKKALAEAKAAEAQKDSLLTEVLETTQFVSDVNSELAKAKTVATKPASTDPGVPGAKKDREERVAALERVKTVIAKLNESEAKLAETETRAKQSRQRNARLLAQIETYKKSLEDLRTTAEQQKTEYEAALAEKLVEGLVTEFEPSKYHDEYQSQLGKLIEAKREGQEVPAGAPRKLAPVIDLMQALQQSLGQVQKKPAAREVQEAAEAKPARKQRSRIAR